MADIKPPLSGNQSVRDVINNVEKQEALSKQEGNSTSVQERLSSIESMLKYNKTADDVKKIGEAVGDIQKKIQSLIETVNNKPIQTRNRSTEPTSAISEEDQLFEELQQSNKKLGTSNIALERELKKSLNRRKQADDESSDLEKELNQALEGEEDSSKKRKKQKEEYKSKLQLAEEKKKKEKEEAQLEAEAEQKYKDSLTTGSMFKKLLGDAIKPSNMSADEDVSMGAIMKKSNDDFYKELGDPDLEQIGKPGKDKLKEARDANTKDNDDKLNSIESKLDAMRNSTYKSSSSPSKRSKYKADENPSDELERLLNDSGEDENKTYKSKLSSSKRSKYKADENPSDDLDRLLSDAGEDTDEDTDGDRNKKKKEYKSKLQLAEEKKKKEKEEAQLEAEAEEKYKDSLTTGSMFKKLLGDAIKPSNMSADEDVSMGAIMKKSNDDFYKDLGDPDLEQIGKPGKDKLKEARDAAKVDANSSSGGSVQNSLNKLLDEEYQKENANLIAKTVVKQFKKEKMLGKAVGSGDSEDSEKEGSEDNTLSDMIQDKAADKLENMLMKGGKNLLGKSKGLGGKAAGLTKGLGGKALGAVGKGAAVAGIGMSAYGAYSAFTDEAVSQAKIDELRDQSVGERALGALNPLEGGKAIGTAGKLGVDIYKAKAEEGRVEDEAGKTASNLDIDFEGKVAKYKTSKTKDGTPISDELAKAKAAAESIKLAGIGPASYIETQDSSSMEPEEKKISAEISAMLNTLNVDIDDKDGSVKNKEDVESKLNNIKTIKTKWDELKALGEKGINSPWRGKEDLVKKGDELYGTTLTDMSKVLEDYIKGIKEPTIIPNQIPAAATATTQPSAPAATATTQPSAPAATATTQPSAPAATATTQPSAPAATATTQPSAPAATATTQPSAPAATATTQPSAIQSLADVTKESSSAAKATSESGNQGVVSSINSSLVGAVDGIKKMLAEESKNKQPSQVIMNSNTTSSQPQDNKSYDLLKMLSTGVIGGNYG